MSGFLSADDCVDKYREEARRLNVAVKGSLKQYTEIQLKGYPNEVYSVERTYGLPGLVQSCDVVEITSWGETCGPTKLVSVFDIEKILKQN